MTSVPGESLASSLSPLCSSTSAFAFGRAPGEDARDLSVLDFVRLKNAGAALSSIEQVGGGR